MTSHRTIPTGPNREELVDSAERALRTTIQGPLLSSKVSTAETFASHEVLADQSGDGTVKEFDFVNGAVDLAWVRCQGGVGRASGTGADAPAVNRGAYCADGEPEPITVRGTKVRVFAPVGVTISVWGYRF